METNILSTLVISFFATLGFAGLLHAPLRSWLPASLIGAAGYTVYWLLLNAGWDDPSAIFVGSCLASLLAQLTARRLRMIASIFSVLAIIPCVPGYGLYQTMFHIGQGNLSEGLSTGVATMSSILMIALGIIVGSFAFRLFHIRKKV